MLECWIQYALSLTMCIRNCYHVEFSMLWALLCISETALMLNSVCFEPYYVYPKMLECWIQYDLSLTMCIRNCSHVEFSMLWALICISETALILNSVCFEHYYVYPKMLECWIQYALSLTMCIRNCSHVEFSMLWALLCVSENARMLNSVCFEPYHVYPKLLECWIEYALSLTMCIRNCSNAEFSILWALLCVSETALMLNSVCFEAYYVYPKLLECWIQYALSLTMYIRNCSHVEFSMLWALLSVSETARKLNSVFFELYYMYPNLNSVCFEPYDVYLKLLSCWIQYALSLTMCIRNCSNAEFSMLWALLCVSETARMLNLICTLT
jgi:hypothetical protein